MEYRFSSRAWGMSASLIRQMFNYAGDVPGAVSLGVGVPSFSLPTYVAKAAAEALRNDPHINKYVLGRGLPELNRAVAEKLEKSGIEGVDPETEILTTTGSAGGIFCTTLAVVDYGDDVVVPSPAYSNHIEGIRFAGGKPVYVPLIESEGWRLDVDGIERAITERTKAIVLCNPANPTGAVFPEYDMRAVGEIAKERDLLIFEDNAYAFLTYGDNKHFSLTSVPELRDNVIAFFTPSKEHAMTGFRVGWVVANGEVIRKVFDIQDQNYICAPKLSQYIALVALTGPQDHVEAFRRELAHRRSIMCARLDRIPGFTYQIPQGAYYVFPRLDQTLLSREITDKIARRRWEEIPEEFQTPDTTTALNILYEAGVVTVPGISFGPQGEGHLRLSFSGEEKDIIEALDRIEKWVVQ